MISLAPEDWEIIARALEQAQHTTSEWDHEAEYRVVRAKLKAMGLIS